MNKVADWWNSLTENQQAVVRFGVFSQASMSILVRVLFMYLLGMAETQAALVLLAMESLFFLTFFKVLESELDYPAPWTRLDNWLNERYGDHGNRSQA